MRRRSRRTFLKHSAWRNGAASKCVLCIVLSALGCTEQSDPEAPGTAEYLRQDSSGIHVHLNGAADHVGQWLADRVIFEVGADEDPALWRVAGAVPFGSGVAVADNASRSILLFDADGRQTASLGGEGDGPGEFRDVGSLWLSSSGRLVVFDRELQRLTAYTPSGDLEFTQGMRPASPNPPRPTGLLGEGTGVVVEVLFDPPASGFGPLPAQIRMFNGSGVSTIVETTTGSMGRVQLSRGSFLGSPHFEPGLQAVAQGDQVWYSRCDQRQVVGVDSTGTVAELIRWAGEPLTVDRASIEEYRRMRLEGLVGVRHERVAERFDALPASDAFPACDAMLANGSGELFVRRYSRPFERDQVWLVFKHGRLVRSVRVPRDTTVTWIDSLRIVTVERDDMDVEYVRMREIAAESI